MTCEGQKVAPISSTFEIVNQIADSNLPPGTVLESETEMMEKFGVSRASLRESLRILEMLGLLWMKPGPGGGPVVDTVDGRDFGATTSLYYQLAGATYLEIVEARVLLEPSAARLAAERRTEAHVEALEEFSLQARAADLTVDPQFRRAGQDFHGLLAEMTGNRVLSLLVRSCTEVFGGHVEYLYPIASRPEVLNVHDAISAAVVGQQSELAAALMKAHMEEYLRYGRELFATKMDDVVQW